MLFRARAALAGTSRACSLPGTNPRVDDQQRNVRRQVRHELEGHHKEARMSDDDIDRAEKELDKITAEHVADIDLVLQHKEQELLEV